MDRSRGSYDSRGEGKVFKMGGGESYRPAGDPPRSPIGRADTFRSSDRDRDRDRDRSPRRERARTPIRDRDRDRDRDRARTPIRDRARTPIRDRARTPIRERARTPPPTDRYLPPSRDRSPRRRSRSPGTYRRRERSPIRDSRDGSTWRARDRARSPPPRRISPRRDSSRRGSPRRGSPRRASPRRDSPRRDDYRRDRGVSPRRDLIRDRDTRGRSRSPYDRDRGTARARSPLPSRRSPPPAAQRGGWRRSSRTPERRNERVFAGPTSLTWRRPRSPSPPPRGSQQTSGRDSGKDSGSTSRRSSPRGHPSRVELQPSRASTPINRDRSPSVHQTNYRDEDVDMHTPQDRSPVRPPVSRESPIRRSPPRGPSGYRAPPSGPSGGHRNFTAPALSVSAHNRPENNGVLAAPAGPRGYQPPFRGRGGGRGSFSTVHRGENTWHNPALIRPTASVSPSPTLPAATPTAPSGIPTGPRAGSSHTIVTDRSKTWTAVPPRAPASSTPSFSRPTTSQRFDTSSAIATTPGNVSSKPHIRNHPSLSTLPTIVVGGRKDPNASGMPRDLEARLKKNEEEAERLREDLRIKEEKVRVGLRGWERLERESKAARLRSELSEQQVRLLAGEGIGGAF